MYHIGEKVMINPYWQSEEGDFGITTWRNYIGKVYTISSKECSTDLEVYELKECILPFSWPDYMLMPVENTIKSLLRKRNGSNER